MSGQKRLPVMVDFEKNVKVQCRFYVGKTTRPYFICMNDHLNKKTSYGFQLGDQNSVTYVISKFRTPDFEIFLYEAHGDFLGFIVLGRNELIRGSEKKLIWPPMQRFLENQIFPNFFADFLQNDYVTQAQHFRLKNLRFLSSFKK
jgi:hypothetical protein